MSSPAVEGGPKRLSPLYDDSLRAHQLEQKALFYKAVAMGLYLRLHRVNRPSAETAKDVIEICIKLFDRWVERGGIEEAQKQVTEFIHILTRRYVDSWDNLKPTPIELYRENVEIQKQLDGMPRTTRLQQRQQWLEEQGLSSEQAAETDGALSEIIQANRHHVSVSWVHKELARAHRIRTKLPS
jgi:hypothetical protein